MLPTDARHELDWLAFRYIAGEMPADEVSRFEERLAHDQEAREEVARAVELASAVARAGTGFAEVLALRPSPRPARAWLAVVAAAACLAAVLLHARSARPTRPAGPSPSAGESSREVALAWSGLRQDREADPGPQLIVADWAEDALVTTEGDVSPAGVGPGTDDTALPAWLLDAASFPAGNPSKEN